MQGRRLNKALLTKLLRNHKSTTARQCHSKSPSSTTGKNNNNNNSKKQSRVRFGAVSVTTVPVVDMVNAADLWYTRQELQELLANDLTLYSRCDNDTNTNDFDSRGLEFYLPHNQYRHTQSERHVRAVVNKAHQARRYFGPPSTSSATFVAGDKQCWCGGGLDAKRTLLWLRRTKRPAQSPQSSLLVTMDPWQWQHMAQWIQQYASQLSWKSREVALGQALQDQAQAQLIYQQDSTLLILLGTTTTTTTTTTHSSSIANHKRSILKQSSTLSMTTEPFLLWTKAESFTSGTEQYCDDGYCESYHHNPTEGEEHLLLSTHTTTTSATATRRPRSVIAKSA